MLDQVVNQLAKIELEDEDIAEYIAGILEDESIEEEEKHEVISEFLSEATDKDTNDLITTLLANWKQVQDSKKKEAEEKKSKLIEDAKAREEERRLRAEKEQEENSTLRAAQKQLSKEQKEAREKLVQQYGYVADGDDEPESDNKEPSKDRRKKGVPQSALDSLLEANTNASAVREKEQQRREEMKVLSEKEKERNKMLQAKQKKDKELDKEKKKTQKGERRRM